MATPTGPGTPGHDPSSGYGQPAVGQPAATHGYPPQQQAHGGGRSGPAIGDRASHAADTVARHVKTPETKEFFKTSEFIVWALTALGVLIAAAVITEGDGSDFSGERAWLYVTIASAAYIVSRGIAKAGTRRGYGDAPMDRGNGGY